MSVPNNIISIDDANDLYANFKNNMRSASETQFATIDYQELKDYLSFIEKEASDAGVTIEGLRVYFGKNPKGKFPSSKTPLKPDANTVFINPTTNFSGIIGEISFAIQTIGTNKRAVTVGDVLNNRLSSIQSLSGNDWELPPPPPSNDPNDFHI